MAPKPPTYTTTLSSPPPSPRERAYPETELVNWIYEAQEAAYLGAEVFERYFTIAGEKMLCRIGFYWTDKADITPRIGKLECLPAWLLEEARGER
jgi:hypothetical protein